MRALPPARLAHPARAALARCSDAAFARVAMSRDSRGLGPPRPLVDDDDVRDGATLDGPHRVVAPRDDLEPAALAALSGRCRPRETAVRDREARPRGHVLGCAVRPVESARDRVNVNEAQAADRRVRRAREPDSEPGAGLVPADVEIRAGAVRDDL